MNSMNPETPKATNREPAYISTQLHKGIGGSGAYINYAIWESVGAFRNAFTNPEFQHRIGDYPESVVAPRRLFKKLAFANHCTEQSRQEQNPESGITTPT